MDGDQPVGGQWNFDADNRESFGKAGPPADLPPPLRVAPDATTLDWLAQRPGHTDPAALDGLASDPGSADVQHDFDAGALSPQLAAPHSPAHAVAIAAHADTRIDIAYIGACTGAKLDDMRFAASVLRGRKVAAGVQLLLAPASLQDRAQAEREGTMQTLTDAGATILPSTCGACAGYGTGFGEGQTVISSTARNFKGRMGPASTQVFLGSAYTVAASALRGRITDPRAVLQ